MKKILFISHEASLTGAPMVLLYLMAWIKDNRPEFQTGILLLNGGEIEQRFFSLANHHHIFQYKKIKNFKKFIHKIKKHIFRQNILSQNELFYKHIANQGYDIIYANTVLSVEKGVQIKNLSIHPPKLIAHIHELEVILNSVKIPTECIPQLDEIIAVSHLVKNNIIKNWPNVAHKINVIYEFSKIKADSTTHLKDNNTFVVGASGYVHWRKGYDIFIQVARFIKKNHPAMPIKFQWVGKVQGLELNIIQQDLEKLQLLDFVEFLGQKEEPIPYLNNFDVFLMCSREDPFPLVCIEVGQMGKPIICFEKATGTAEVLSNGGGKIIPYLDIESMAETIVFYYSNQEALDFDSQKAKEIFNNFTPEIICPQIYQLIENVIKHK
jgi:glycosyltransferase involved in cell wall biosynthesis